MPPKGSKPSALHARSRRQAHRERGTTARLNRLDLNVEQPTEAESRPPTSRTGEPRHPQTDTDIIRNYEPQIPFHAVKVTIAIVYGTSYTHLPDVSKIESTMGRARTKDQVEGLIKNNNEVRTKLDETYNMATRSDVRTMTITFTDAAAYRHRVDFENRWNTPFGIWAGEVESGDLPAEPPCQCGVCDGTHGPVIEVGMDRDKAVAVLGEHYVGVSENVEADT